MYPEDDEELYDIYMEDVVGLEFDEDEEDDNEDNNWALFSIVCR